MPKRHDSVYPDVSLPGSEGAPTPTAPECNCRPQWSSEDARNYSLEFARIATLVATGWLLVLLCCYWQYRILQPYARSLLWAAICATALRKGRPIVDDLAGKVSPPHWASATVPPEDEPSFVLVWLRSFLGFLAKPFLAFCSISIYGPYPSRLFFSMLGRGWLLWAIWWTLTRQLLAATLIGAALAVAMLCFYSLRRLVEYALDCLCPERANRHLRKRARSLSEVPTQIRKQTVLGFAVAALVMVCFAVAYQLHFEVLYISRIVAAQLPSSTMDLIRDEHGDLALPEFIQQRVAQVNMSSPDVCGALRKQLSLDDDADAAFASICAMAQERLSEYLHAPATLTRDAVAVCRLPVFGAPEEMPVDVNTTCNATGDEGGSEAAHEPPFHVLTRKLHENAKDTLRGFLPDTSTLFDKAYRYLATADDVPMPSPAPTFQDVRKAALELKVLLTNVTESVRVSTAAEVLPEMSRLMVKSFWGGTSKVLFGLYFVMTSAFDIALQMVVFAGATMHLYCAEWGPLEYLKVLMVSVDQTRGEKLYGDLDNAIGAALGAPLKLALFHTLFTCLLLVCFGSRVVCIPAALAGVCAVISPPWAHIVTLLEGFNLWSSEEYWGAAFVWAITAMAWWFVPDSIYSDIAHPFVTGLSIVMGASCMGPIGCILGPILIVVPIEVLQSLTREDPQN